MGIVEEAEMVGYNWLQSLRLLRVVGRLVPSKWNYVANMGIGGPSHNADPVVEVEAFGLLAVVPRRGLGSLGSGATLGELGHMGRFQKDLFCCQLSVMVVYRKR